MSTQAQALAEARRLQAIMRSYGVECVIDLMPGASSSGWMSPLSQRVGVFSHHIVSRRSMGATRFYELCRDGRADVPGPLCNGYGGWDRVYRIITLGWANHPGKGGPLRLPGGVIPKDGARPYAWGTEFEGGMDEADWDPEHRAWMARVNAAILDWLGLPTTAHVEHSTWAPGRKNDRLRYSPESGRKEIAAVRGTTPPQEDDMPTLNEIMNTKVTKAPDGTDVSLGEAITALWRLGNLNYDDTPGRVWAHGLVHTVAKTVDGKPVVSSAGDLLRYEPAEHANTRQTLEAAIKAGIGTIPGLSQDQVDRAVAKAIAELASITTSADVTVTITPRD